MSETKIVQKIKRTTDTWERATLIHQLVVDYGMTPTEIAVATKFSPSLCRKMLKTVQVFPLSKQTDLSYRHHQIAACTGQPYFWIKEAVKNNWSTRDFWNAVHEQEKDFLKAKNILKHTEAILNENPEASIFLKRELSRIIDS